MNNPRTKSLVCRAWKNYLVYVHGTTAPTEAEWEHVLDQYAKLAAVGPRILVFTMGAAPSAAQRGRLRDAHGASRPPMAILTSSIVARAAGTAYSWFNPHLRLFALHDVDAALEHLGATAEDASGLRGVLTDLRTELGSAAGAPSAYVARARSLV